MNMKNLGNLKGMGGLGNMANLAKQAQQMMEKAKRTEEELAAERVEGSAGGGMVRVTATGTGEVLAVVIDPQVVDADDVEMLQDLVLGAVREAIQKSVDLRSERMKELTGGLGLPGMF
jgi:DNA-binding YbaB/EbfC family protein